MDLHHEASIVVGRALLFCIPDLEARNIDVHQSSLRSLFPSDEQLSSFVVVLSGFAQKARADMASEFDRQSAAPPEFVLSVVIAKTLTVAQVMERVESYLGKYRLRDSATERPEATTGVIRRPEPPGPPAASAPAAPAGPMAPAPPPARSSAARPPSPPSGAPEPPMASASAPPMPPGAPMAPAPPAASEHRYHSESTTQTGSLPLTSNCSLVQVFYGTDRMQTLGGDGKPSYDERHSALGKISYGVCAISIPKTHKRGMLETPSILKLEFRPDPEKHIVLQSIQSVEEDVFLQKVGASVDASASKEAFIFIHGYKVSFEDAARRTGQLAFDLEFVGAPIFYSWPSYGKLADYTRDENNVIWSAPHFQRFVGLLAQHSGAQRIHIIAHSMGNRAVCDALKALSNDPATQFKLNHLILAAADIDADTFRELAANLQKISGRVTLYESSRDKALMASKKIHGNPRAGEPLLVVSGLDTIDASAIDTDFLGHSYFSDNWPLLADIHSILRSDELPGVRFGLMEMDCPDGKYYAFRA